MLETAACDLYTQCGLRRLISLSRIHDFIVPHLPNKYYSQMGIPVEDLDLQVASLRQLRRDGGWAGKLFEPESGAPRFRWSKNLYERPDERLLEAIPHEAQSVLSVGCGWGENEAWLIRRRLDVCAVPLDAVFGAFLRNRGIRAVIGPLSEALDSLRGERFDAVLLADVLHLVGDPVDWLRRLASFLKPDGRLVASVPNTGEIASRLKHWREGRGRLKSPGDPVRAAHQVSVRRLRSWLKAAGLAALSIAPCREGSERPLRRWASELIGPPMAPRFILSAGRSDSNP
jgi:2-polyprenyl-3-methyl-5-hydroxy-6-metoxy-1,4-benzoquinol methylase